MLGNKVYQKRIYTWRGLNKEMCSCEQDRMNIKLNNSAMGGSSSPNCLTTLHLASGIPLVAFLVVEKWPL